jgi:hypothetical protein
MVSKAGVFIGGRVFGPILHWFVRMSGLSRFLLWLVFDYKGRLPAFVVPWTLAFRRGGGTKTPSHRGPQ